MPKLRAEYRGLVCGSSGAILDGEDWRTGCERSDGYRQICVKGRRDYLHRVVYSSFKPIPYGGLVHHRDGDKSNNSLSNLQSMTVGEHSALHARRRRRNK